MFRKSDWPSVAHSHKLNRKIRLIYFMSGLTVSAVIEIYGPLISMLLHYLLKYGETSIRCLAVLHSVEIVDIAPFDYSAII